jgi:hypothetical protein
MADAPATPGPAIEFELMTYSIHGRCVVFSVVKDETADFICNLKTMDDVQSIPSDNVTIMP